MKSKGIKIRNKQEELAVETMYAAHEYLNTLLNVQTDLVFQRQCNWGKNARHAGWYRSSEKLVALNFRNMYGATIQDLLEVLAHEMRHAVQDAKGWHKLHSAKNGMFRMLRGTWKGETMYVAYQDAPWEVDARAYEKPYSQEAIEALNIPQEVLQTRLPMGTLTTSNKNATFQKLNDMYTRNGYVALKNTWLKRKPKGSGIAYVIQADLPKGFNWKKREDLQWLYDNQQLINFMPYIKVTEEYGGFSVREMVS